MPIATGQQLEFWRHLLSLNGIDWESEQVSFSDDDECYACMTRMCVSFSRLASLTTLTFVGINLQGMVI